MDIIQELLRKLSQRVFNKAVFMGKSTFNKPDKNQIEKFLTCVRDNKTGSEEEVAKKMGIKTGTTKFQTLKSRAISQLMLSVFMLNVDKNTFIDSFKVFYKCNMNLLAGRIMVRMGSPKAGAYFLEKSLTKAEQYQLNLEIIAATQLLKNYYIHANKAKKVKLFEQKRNMALSTLENEYRIQDMYQELSNYFLKHKFSSPEIIKKSNELAQKSDYIINKHFSNHIYRYYLYINIISCELNGQYIKVLKYSNEGFEYFNKKTVFKSTTIAGTYLLQKLNALLLLGKYKEGRSIFNETLEYFKPNSINRRTVYLTGFLLELYAFNFENAKAIFKEVEQKIKNNELTFDYEKEIWIIFNAYLGLVHYNVNSDKNPKILIEPDKLKSSCPALSKDFKGWNIPLRVYEFCYLYFIKDWDQLINISESILTYKKRYIDKEFALERSSLFFSLMYEVALGKNEVDALKSGNEYIKKISRIKRKNETALKLEEVIPYERLWLLLS